MATCSELFSPPLPSQQTDFQVVATVHVKNFPDKTEVFQLLRSHGFELMELDGGQVRVRGYFLKLRDVKDHLELLLHSKTETPPRSGPAASPLSISEYYNKNNNADWPPPSSPTSAGSSHRRRASLDHRYQQASRHPGRKTLVVDGDMFRYARQIRRAELEAILTFHDVRMSLDEGVETTAITLSGKTSTAAESKLQTFLDDLSQSLRTQELTPKDMSHEGKDLLEIIKRNKNISGLVLVCFMEDRLRLIGPSQESYELKQRLLGRPVNQSGLRGRPVNKASRVRSRSLPPPKRRSSGREGGAISSPSAGGATCSSPSADDGQQGPSAALDRSRAQRRRSISELRDKKEAGKVLERENRRWIGKSFWGVIRQMFTQEKKTQTFKKPKK